MTTPDAPTTVAIPNAMLWLLRIGAAALGLVLGLLAKPLMQWILELIGEAPGPLRLAAALPTTWAVIVLTAVGLIAGILLAQAASKESLTLTVGPDDVRLSQNGADGYLPREAITEVFKDGKDLVFLGENTTQLARYKATDLSRDNVRAAFERYGYPWRDGDPYERDFQRWMDGHPGLDEPGNGLLRARARALRDKQLGRAAELAEESQRAGIVIRDRDGAQQYRRIPG